jgi:hypothetical protein
MLCATANWVARRPQRVKSGHAALKLQCLLYSRKRTFADATRMSALGQKQTSRSAAFALLDNVVRDAEQRRRHGEPEHASGRSIDYQLKLARFNDW